MKLNDEKALQSLYGMVNDALENAVNAAQRAVEATEGTPLIIAFDAARKAIKEFKQHNPAMQDLFSAVLKEKNRQSNDHDGDPAP